VDEGLRTSEKIYISETENDWLALNWRKYAAAQLSKSNRRMILEMFESDRGYFPTLREIRDGLIKGQMMILKRKSKDWSGGTQFGLLKKNYESKWNMLFDFNKLGDIDEPLKKKDLQDPENQITKHILYIYSMESFIY